MQGSYRGIAKLATEIKEVTHKLRTEARLGINQAKSRKKGREKESRAVQEQEGACTMDQIGDVWKILENSDRLSFQERNKKKTRLQKIKQETENEGLQ